jgi:AcrR family transcriptional regulator
MPTKTAGKRAAPAGIATKKPPRINQQGQVIGRKGQQTRERIVDAVEMLLQTQPLRDLKQAEVCRIAKVSPPAFYVYFRDIETAVREAIARHQVLPAELDALLQEPWPEAEVFARAQRFVTLYLEYWEQHYHLFKTRNLSADEGDPAMIELRLGFQVPVMEKIAALIAEGQSRSGQTLPTPRAGAAIVMASLERLAPTLRFTLGPTPPEGMSVKDVIDAAASVLTRLINDK